ncbi:Myosin-6 (AtMYA2) [Durusdinium trenchii]|uniref:Myosin-6 (AtMYA2) n=1 Tax=Durusdinium trenchii TaxID=1381693 RepID=A0ABP0HW57_9DINO
MRKVWIRKNAQDKADEVGWVPAAVVKDEGEGSSEEHVLSVQLESWAVLDKKAPGGGRDYDSDSDSSDFAENADSEVNEEELLEVKAPDVLDRNAWDSPPADLVQLVHLHEPAILQALCERFWASTIYTWCGPILLAVNPFERLPLYRQAILETYQRGRGAAAGDDAGSRVPHVYAVAADSYRCLVDKSGREGSDTDQAILISGESGAGKTETTKIVMQYLATVARRPREDGKPIVETLHVSEYLAGDEPLDGAQGAPSHEDVGQEGHYSIEQKVLESNPILEAFGNARTIRNDNSSRFGKFIQIQFDKQGYLVGASIATYLLEKVRIIQQGEGERGYHVFYQMLFGGSEAEKKRWHFSCDAQPNDFAILSAGNCFDRRDGVSDAQQLEVTKRALTIMGLSPEEQDAVFDLVAAVMHMGNLGFVRVAAAGDEDDDTHAASKIERAADSEALCALLHVEHDQLERALCTRTVSAGGESFEVKLRPEDAADTRDALAKSTYSRAFDWLVSRVNECIQHPSRAKRFIGVLDIFGFEIFMHNSFEQLCINYANERLQQQFNDFVFQHEQTIYKQEKIAWNFIDFPSNASTVGLIDSGAVGSKEMGILALLDDECRLPKGNDQGFARKLYDKCLSRERFEASKSQQVRGEFAVHHYAGVVVYDTAGFCDKNRDSLRQEAVDLMLASPVAFVKSLFEQSETQLAAATAAGTPRGGKSGSSTSSFKSSGGGSFSERRSALSLSSVSAEFRRQLSSLIDTIEHTAPHYIRCIKPNDVAKPKVVHRGRAVSQLRCGGVLEAVRVARAGFPIRMPHRVFVERYGRLAGPAALRIVVADPDAASLSRGKAVIDVIPKVGGMDRSESRKLAREVLDVLKVNFALLPDDAEAVDLDVVSQVGKTKVFLRKQGHDIFERIWARWRRRAASVVTAFVLGRAKRTRFRKVRNATVVIQAVVRGKRARRQAHELRVANAALRVQSWARSQRARLHFTRVATAARAIQRVERGRRARKVAHELRRDSAVLTIQSWHRAQPFRGEFMLRRATAVRLQCAWRCAQARMQVREARRQARDLSSIIKERDALRAKVQALLKQEGGTASTKPLQVSSFGVDGSGGDGSGVHVEQRGLLDPRVRSKAVLIGAAAHVTLTLWRNISMFSPDRIDAHFKQKAAKDQQQGGDKVEARGMETAEQGQPSPPDVTIAPVVAELSGELLRDPDWYNRTFGAELQQVERANFQQLQETEGQQTLVEDDGKDHEPGELQFPDDDVSEIEQELAKRRQSLETKRAELQRFLSAKQDDSSCLPGGGEEAHNQERGDVDVDEDDVAHDPMVRDIGEQVAQLGHDLELAQSEKARADEELASLRQRDTERYDQIEALRAELEDTKAFVGQQVGLKNQAEIKQGELELQVSALEQQRAKAEEDLARVNKEKEALEEKLQDIQVEQASNRDVRKSAAVLQLETELRVAQQELDVTREELEVSQAEIEVFRKEEDIKGAAMEDFRSSLQSKVDLLEGELGDMRKAKARAEMIHQARLLVDRRSRKVAQNVITTWAGVVREKRQLRQRAACARRVFAARRLRRAFARWADDTQRGVLCEERLASLLLRKSRSRLKAVFEAWLAQARRAARASAVADVMVHAKSQRVLERVLCEWRTTTASRLAERSRFAQLEHIFRHAKLRRTFAAWQREHTRDWRLEMLLQGHRARSRRTTLIRCFLGWVCLSHRSRLDHTVDSASAASSRGGGASPRMSGTAAGAHDHSMELVATLMKRMEQQEEKIAALLEQESARQEATAQMTPAMPFQTISGSRAEIEEILSDDDDDEGARAAGELQEEDSFYNPTPKISSFKLGTNGRSRSDRLSLGSRGGGENLLMMTPSPGPSRSRHDEVFRSGRKPSVEPVLPFSPGTKDLEAASRGQGQDLEASASAIVRSANRSEIRSPSSIFRSASSPKLLGTPASHEANGEMLLGTVGISQVNEDGTLAFHEEPKYDVETVLRTAETLGTPPLVLAAKHGLYDTLCQLLEDGRDPNEEDASKHRTVLHAAIQAHQWSGDGSEKMVEKVLESGARVDARNAHGNTPLMEAVLKGDDALALTMALIRHGAMGADRDEGANEFGQTPLHAAVRVGAVKTTHALLNNGASLMRGDGQGQTALHHAARLCNVNMLQNLLGFRSMSSNGSRAGSPESRDVQDGNGNTALHLVCSSTSAEMSKAIFILLESDFDPNLKNRSGQTPLHILCSNKNASRHALKQFARPKVHFYEQDRLGNTALHMACYLDIRKIACTLVKIGAELYVPNEQHETPFDLVSQAFAIELLKAIRTPPDEDLAKKFHRDVRNCMICTNKFAFFRDQVHCRHCGRVCCAKCASKKFPLIKFNVEESVSLCDHCFKVLTLPEKN